jgi:hypothetical protein
MKWEMPVFVLLVILGVSVRKMTLGWRYGLVIFVAFWIFYSWLKA